LKIHEDDVSKRMFMDALKEALSRCDSVWHLSLKLGLKSHCYGWIKGNTPPYKTMQKVYFRLLDIIDQNPPRTKLAGDVIDAGMKERTQTEGYAEIIREGRTESVK